MFGNLVKRYYLYTHNTKTMKETQITKRINHDTMSISCRFPSGGRFKYRVTRYDTKLEIAFSNVASEAKVQIKIFLKWLKDNHTSTYGSLFDKIESLCKGCKTGKELIKLMNI